MEQDEDGKIRQNWTETSGVACTPLEATGVSAHYSKGPLLGLGELG